MKCIIVVCGAYPDQGKGIVTGALSYVLASHSHSSLPFKYDGYLNVSSGEMNPLTKSDKIAYQNEEVFVLEDGFETDADSGVYERFTGKELGSWHMVSYGKLTLDTITDRAVESGKIQNHLDVIKAAEAWISQALDRTDMPVIEVGGTVGDFEHYPLFSALKRVSRKSEVPYKVVLLAPYMVTVGDTDRSTMLSFRTKITRMALDHLEQTGLMADVIACNSPDGSFSRGDIAHITTNYSYLEGKVINLRWRENIYEKTQDALEILRRIDPHWVNGCGKGRLEKYAESCMNPQGEIAVCIAGDTVSNDTYGSMIEGVKHSAYALGLRPRIEWVESKPAEGYDMYIATNSSGYQILKDSAPSSLLAVGEAFRAYVSSIGTTVEENDATKELQGVRTVYFSVPRMWLGSDEQKSTTTRFRHVRGFREIDVSPSAVPSGSTVDFARVADGRIVGIKVTSESALHTVVASHPEFDSKPGLPSEIILKHMSDTCKLAKKETARCHV